MITATRREFLRRYGTIGAGFLGLARFIASPVCAQQAYQNEVDRFGTLEADPYRILDLPKGFSYEVISRTGERMNDGFYTPGAPDGMAAFAGPNGRVILVRNHELTDDQTFDGPFGLRNELYSKLNSRQLYDAGKGTRPQLGGTTTVVYDPQAKRLETQFLSLVGTTRNCAGGLTPWGSWITCEETVDRVGDHREKDHGYNFEVPATATPSLADPVPLKAMGRFRHEAVCVDPASGIVYETEDQDDGLLYRFIPNESGKLIQGGRLQALKIKGEKSVDTRNWPATGAAKFPIGEAVDVEWQDVQDVESPKDDLRARGFKRGAARFARGEGIWFGNRRVYIACTNGGISKTGQIFEYVPSPYEGTEREAKHPGALRLYLEPNNTQLLEYGDNLTVSPWGDVVLCEDGAESQYLRGITPTGKIYTLARNAYTGNSELAGICFAPNHPTAFVNIQRPGITLAITGPWEQLVSG